MKVLILGSTGLLGNTLSLFLKSKGVNLFFITKSKSNIFINKLNNIKNFKKLEEIIMSIDPDYIVNCIGVTHYHKSYVNKKKTKLINSTLPIFLSKLCLKKKIYFLHISTDCVYSGISGNYSEKSKKTPLSYYGLSKSMGEVKNLYSATIRTSFIGPGKRKNNQLLNWFLSQKKEIKGFKNAYFSGLTSLELSKIIYVYFLKINIYYNYIFNIGGPKISKYKLLYLFSKVFNKKIVIKKEFNYKIDRSLNSNRFKKLSKYKTISWIVMLMDLKKFMVLNNFKF